MSFFQMFSRSIAFVSHKICGQGFSALQTRSFTEAFSVDVGVV
jgi:hypothetical protein